MGIEPITSTMALQAQGAVVQKPQAPVRTENPNNVDNTVGATEQIDRTLNGVESAREKGQADSEEQGKNRQPRNDQIRKAIEKLNKKIGNAEAIFGIHEKTNRVTIKLVDKDTKEVIREFPPEETLDMIAKIWDVAGILVDEKR